ncbi:hypothetical protein MKX01_013139 [Papaver californicum]|nr:hypothetical protein MKX01_013139 [Papaver californicum]
MVMKKPSSYEDLRLQTMQENMKRMQDLKLNHLALNLKKCSISKPRVMVQKKLELLPEVDDIQFERRKCRSAGFCKRRDGLGDYPVASEIERADATRKAEELNSNLIRDDGFPCFVKCMLHSHGLPTSFCRQHFPEHDETITLVDEPGDEFETNYLAQKMGLSGGWRRFAMVHGLIDGDASVFQLSLRNLRIEKRRRKMERNGEEEVVCVEFITLEILSRLPVKSLMRFKCVCKRWQSIIHKDQFFIDLHLSRSITM